MANRTTERILLAAAEAFASHGFSAASTKDIAKAAGVNETTIFRQFHDKRSLLESAIRHEVTTVLNPDRIKDALAIRDFDDAMRTYARLLMELFSPRYVRLSSVYALEMPQSHIDAFTHKFIRPPHEALAARIRAEQRAKRVRSNIHPFAISRSLICLLYGHAASFAFWGKEWKRVTRVKPEHIDSYVTMWLRGALVESSHLR